MVKMMNTGDEFIGPVNIGNPEEYRIVDLARKIIEMTATGSKIIHLPLPEDDPKQRQPDISLAKEKLNWIPVVNLDTGLARTIEYFKKKLHVD
jgi:UDP-glucuronate decarboxylase